MNVTPELLAKIYPNSSRVRREVFAEALEEARVQWGIDTPRRLASWLAQIGVESAELNALQENLYYTSAGRLQQIFSKLRNVDPTPYVKNPERLANFVYADRNGNGDESSGDGWRFIGRGPPQLTGRNNYREIGLLIKRELEHNPTLMVDPFIGSLAAAAFWRRAGCAQPADNGDIDGVTRRFNPAMVAAAGRRAYYNVALSELGG